MADTMESARRWSAFVCPDCRFVFRVPRDHDGKGVVCTSCRRLLRIPQAGDRPAPLVVPIRQHELATTSTEQETDTPAEPETESTGSRRRKRKSRRGESHSWDQAKSNHRRSRKKEKRQMLWMLVGGCTLLLLIVAGVLAIMSGGSHEPPTIAKPADTAVPSDNPAELVVPVLSDTEFSRLAEPVAKAFLEATTIEQLLPHVREPERAKDRMLRIYPDGMVDAQGMQAFNAEFNVIRQGTISSVKVRTRDFSNETMAFVETPEGIKVDWESWVGWSGMPWKEFFSQKPATPVAFRVTVSEVDYYNMGFSDEEKWRSYRLESPDGMESMYGYAERQTVTDDRIRPGPDVKKARFTLLLRFPNEAASSNQVVIDRVLAEGWALETENPQ